MKLNKRMPGLPQWPEIHQEPDCYYVIGKHSTYWRYVAAQALVILLLLAGLILPWVVLKGEKDAAPTALTISAVSVVIALIPLTPRLLCRTFFPCLTRVKFTPQNVRIGWKNYQIRPDTPIQFRAQRTAMSELKAKRLEREALAQRESLHSSYRLRFRRVEMIYGLQIVPITTVADEIRAEQFSVALQAALLLVCARGKTPAPVEVRAAACQSAPQESLLPE